MAGRVLVLDASTAILLAKIGLLRDLVVAGDVWMAETAYQESTIKVTDDARLIRALEGEGLIRHGQGKAGSGKIRKDFRLDEGEAESIVLAQEKSAICGTDDGPAIRCLKVLGIPFTTAVAVLVAMAEVGTMSAEIALELLSKLERFGRYDPRILEDAARRIRSVAGGVQGGKR